MRSTTGRYLLPSLHLGLLLALLLSVLTALCGPEESDVSDLETGKHGLLAASGPQQLPDPAAGDITLSRAGVSHEADNCTGDLTFSAKSTTSEFGFHPGHAASESADNSAPTVPDRPREPLLPPNPHLLCVLRT